MNRYLTWQELQEDGIVMEVNRRLLHPRGLALQYNIRDPNQPEDPVAAVWFFHKDVAKMREILEMCRGMMEEAETWSDEWAAYFDGLMERVREAEDCPDSAHLRVYSVDDPEGIVFGALSSEDRDRADRFLKRVDIKARVAGAGFVIEPHKGKGWKEIEP